MSMFPGYTPPSATSLGGSAPGYPTAPELLIDEPVPGVRRFTMNRPDKLNAMTAALITALHDALDAVSVDRSCRSVIITGAGKGFCAGLDLGGYGEAPHSDGIGTTPKGLAVQKHIASLIPHLRSLPQPVIAAVNGAAAGGGFALVLGSDVRLAARSAKFNAAFVRIGLSACDIGTSWILPKLVGLARSQELMVTGRIIDSTEAERIGLVVRTVDDNQLMASALVTAEQISANSPFGVAMTKEAMWSALEIPGMQAAIDLENRQQIMISATADHREAMAAFVERRTPNWRWG
jgi:enoyl-CoA hydratase